MFFYIIANTFSPEPRSLHPTRRELHLMWLHSVILFWPFSLDPPNSQMHPEDDACGIALSFSRADKFHFSRQKKAMRLESSDRLSSRRSTCSIFLQVDPRSRNIYITYTTIGQPEERESHPVDAQLFFRLFFPLFPLLLLPSFLIFFFFSFIFLLRPLSFSSSSSSPPNLSVFFTTSSLQTFLEFQTEFYFYPKLLLLLLWLLLLLLVLLRLSVARHQGQPASAQRFPGD